MVNEELLENEQPAAEAPAKEKPTLTPEQQKAKKAKVMTIITYSIALLCMFAGLFVPLYGSKSLGVTDRMFFKWVPGITNMWAHPLFKKDLIPLKEGGFFPPMFPADKFYGEFLAVTVYALICVVGLFMLIPVILGKSSKRTSAACAYAVEVIAVISSGYFIFAMLRSYVWGATYSFFNLLIAFGGTLLMMLVQSVYNKGRLGVGKIVLMVLSALVFFFLLNLNALAPALGKIFNPLSKALGSGEEASFSVGTEYVYGFFGTEIKEVLKLGEWTVLEKIFYIVGGAFVWMCIFNFAYDMFETVLGSKYDKKGLYNQNKPMHVLAILRYSVALVLGVATIVLLLTIKDAKPGVYLYIASLIILIQLIFAIIRAGVMAAKRRKAVKTDAVAVKADSAPVFEDDFVFGDNNEVPSEDDDTIVIQTPIYEEREYIYQNSTREDIPMNEEKKNEEAEQPKAEPVVLTPVYEEPEELPEEEDEQLVIPGTPEPDYGYQPESKTEDRTYVYNYRAVYNGPTDEFMDTLDDSEKIEFVQVFLEKTKGRIKGVPDYKIGQDNSDFFPAVFIHINRSREVVSSRLLEKIYKQINR